MTTCENPTLAPGPAQPFALGTGPEAFERMPALVREYGPLVSVPTPRGGPAALIVTDPAAVRQVLVGNADNYRKGPGFERVKMLLGDGIIVTNGDKWRRQRTMMQPAFTRRAIARLVDMIRGVNDRLAARFDALCEGAEAPLLDVTTLMSETALAIVLRAIFGSEEYDTLTTGEVGNPFAFLTDDTKRDLQVAVRFRQLRKLMQAAIDRRRQRGAPETAMDFLDTLVFAEDKQGEPMRDGEILDELMTLIIAGHETSAGTLNWAWYLLAQHPETEAALLDEINAVAAGEPLSHDQLAALEQTQWFLEETLRLYPPVWVFTRRAIDSDTLGGYNVPPGTDIYISPWLLQREPALWDAPDDFQPTRFADDEMRARNRYAFIPFSAGARRCVGEYFSFVEMKLHLAALLPRFRLVYQGPVPAEVLPGINLRSADPLMMRLERRNGDTR